MTKTVQVQQAPPVLPTDEFSKLVEECRRNRDSKIIENTSMAHAAILLKNLLILARDQKTDVQMVSGRLDPAFYDNLVGDVTGVLDAGCKVEIVALCEKDQLKANRFYDKVMSYPAGKVIALPEKAENIHFFVTDGAYRVEVDDAAKKAYASFNDRGGVMTEVLRQKFSELWGGSDRERSSNERSGGERNVSRPIGAN